jgi:hypothetical protein
MIGGTRDLRLCPLQNAKSKSIRLRLEDFQGVCSKNYVLAGAGRGHWDFQLKVKVHGN